MNELAAVYQRLTAEQRAAYDAWQKASPGDEFSATLTAYRTASKALEDFLFAYG